MTAHLESQSANVTAPTYTIIANFDATAWVCSPKEIPCPTLNEIEAPLVPVGYHRSGDILDFTIRPNGTQIADMLGDAIKAAPKPPGVDEVIKAAPKPPQPPPPPSPADVRKTIPEPLRPPIPGIAKCRSPLPDVQTKVGAGTAVATYILRGAIKQNEPIIASEHSEHFRLDSKTKSLIDIIAGSGPGFFAQIGIEQAAKGAVAQSAALVPKEIRLPKGARLNVDLEWTVKSAQFDSRLRNNTSTPAFVVVRFYEGPRALACAIRQGWSKLH